MDISTQEELRERLEGLRWTDLRRTAKEEFGYSAPRTAQRDEIVNALLRLAGDNRTIKRAGSMNEPPLPGWSRVRINTTDRPGGKEPVLLSVNGKDYTINRGVIVDIPTKFRKALGNAFNDQIVPDGYISDSDKGDRYEDIAIEEHDFPFDVISETPGPDPKPTPLERALKRRANARRAAAKTVGQDWLTDAAYKELKLSGALRAA